MTDKVEAIMALADAWAIVAADGAMHGDEGLFLGSPTRARLESALREAVADPSKGEAERDARRYRWLRDKGTHTRGAVITGSGSESISRGPFVLFEAPSCNSFNGIALEGSMCDAYVDAAIDSSAVESSHHISGEP